MFGPALLIARRFNAMHSVITRLYMRIWQIRGRLSVDVGSFGGAKAQP